MKVLFDTSVLVASMVRAHPRHEEAFPWLEQGIEEAFAFQVACHSLAELYSVLTTLPVRPAISPGAARTMILENVKRHARIVPLGASDYASVIHRMAGLEIRGGAFYDALIARAAQKAKADRLLTLNTRDFRLVWPEGDDVIASPAR